MPGSQWTSSLQHTEFIMIACNGKLSILFYTSSAICPRKSHRCQSQFFMSFIRGWNDTLMNESLMGSFVPDCWMLKHSLFCYRLYNLSWHFLLTSIRFYFWFLTCFINNVMIAIAHCLFSSSDQNGDRCFVVRFCLVSVLFMIENVFLFMTPLCWSIYSYNLLSLYFISAWWIPKEFQTT